MASVLILSAITLPVFAVNTLIPPASAKLIALDGQDTDTLNIDNKTGISLKDGQHQLVFQLKSLIRDAGDSRMYTSKPYIMTFTLQGDQTYRVVAPDLKSPANTIALEKKPGEQFSLVNSKGVQTQFALASLKKSGLLAGDPVDDVQTFNRTDAPAAVRAFGGTVQSVAIMAPVSIPRPPQPAPQEASPTSESMLRYWYNQADEQTRREFLQWVAEGKH